MQNTPLLVIVSSRSSNPFFSYLLEILDSEGLNSREVVDIATTPLEADLLGRHSLVMVTDVPLDASQIKRLEDYVHAGGNLIALRPPAAMGGMFGIRPLQGNATRISEGYVTFEETLPIPYAPPADGLQFHGDGDLAEVDGARVLGWFSGKLGERTSYPAITHDSTHPSECPRSR